MRYHATVCGSNPKPVDFFPTVGESESESEQGPRKRALYNNFRIRCWSEKKVYGVD